jgi:hypothetical protein
MIALFSVCSAILLCFGALQTVKTIRLVRQGIRTMATVVAYEARKAEIGTSDVPTEVTFHHPVIEFVDAGARKQRVTLQVASGEKPYAEGSPVKIIYMAEEPEDARIAKFWETWLPAVFLLAMGLVMLGPVLYMWVFKAPIRMG